MVRYWRFAALFISFFLMGCDFQENPLSGYFDEYSEESTEPALSKANSTIEVSQDWVNLGISSEVTLTTRDQFNEIFYDPAITVAFSATGGTSKGYFTDVVNNGDGTYTSTYFGLIDGTANSIGGTLDGEAITSVEPEVSFQTPRLQFTGDSSSTAAVANRIFDEVDGGFTITGDCDVELGDVTLFGDIIVGSDIPCSDAGGGTFSLYINYDTTTPFFFGNSMAQRVAARQGVKWETETFVYKTTSSAPPTIITNLAGLQGITCSDTTVSYILGADIDVATEAGSGVDNFTTLCSGTPFQGTFDGAGFTISNIDIVAGTFDAGLFGQTLGGDIGNVNFDNVNVEGSNDVGVLVGRVGFPMNIRNVHVSNAVVTATGTSVGGIVGVGSSASLYSVSYQGSVSSSSNNVGGIIGNGGSVDGCEFSGSVSGANYVGGIGGYNATRVFRCSSTGTVDGTDYVGGIAGYISFNQNNESNASVSGNQYVGGLMGNAPIYVVASKFDGSVVATSTNAGPLAGDTPTNTNVYYLDSITCTGCDNFPTGAAISAADWVKMDTFEALDFSTTWKIDEGVSAPELW